MSEFSHFTSFRLHFRRLHLSPYHLLPSRGFTSLKLLGDDQIHLRCVLEAVPMPGRYIHTLDGKDNFQSYRFPSIPPPPPPVQSLVV